MNDLEYSQKKRFLVELLNAAPNSIRASNMGDRLEAELLALFKSSPASARRALSATFDDTVQRAAEWGPDVVLVLDKHLTNLGLPALSDALFRHSRLLSKIARKKQLKSEAEYFLAKGLLEARYQELDASIRHSLERLVVLYEESINRSRRTKLK